MGLDENSITFRNTTESNIRDIFEGMDREGYETPEGEVRWYAGSTDEMRSAMMIRKK